MEETFVVYQVRDLELDAMPYIVFDIETTGLDKKECDIIQISAMKIVNGDKIEEFNHFIKPRRPLSDFTTELTGISNEDVQNARKLHDVLVDFQSFIRDFPLIAHNITFDMDFLNEKYNHCNLSLMDNTYIDTLELARRIYPERKRFGLTPLILDYNMSLSSARGRMMDVEVLTQLFPIMLNDAKNEFQCEFIEDLNKLPLNPNDIERKK
ncbi:DNA polymerase III polC-type [Streptococcus sp. DD10]|uniref:3'-5' exonuclease n=1 Tax=Streptococcus sp. DD10 TaxID=1777878 RepID=UPI0007935CF6|nr:exonuclease domain-containing protein [Streptococcus sp. DD10]KXT72327.1 DNA polymerase III polC-type [Streptococcus sp. DD10]